MCGTQSLFYDVKYLICTALIGVISHNKVDLDCDPDCALVHYGVVFVYMYGNNVAQLLLYNIQGLNPDDNNNCNNINRYHDTVRNNNEPTTSQIYDDGVNYVVNDIVRSINSDMNPNNDDNVKVDANRYYDDTNNILPFYLLW